MAPQCSFSAFNQPVFFSTLATGIPYFLSIGWLYRKYSQEMTPREKEIMWAGLFTRNESHFPTYFTMWCVTAALSAMGFLCSWAVALVTAHCGNDMSRWDTPAAYVFAGIILIQTVYNLVMAATCHTQEKKYVFAEIMALAFILWTSVAGSLWMWYLGWQLLLAAADSSSDALKWGLHFLNLCMVFHCLCWDALFWWWTWAQAKMADSGHHRKLIIAERETLGITDEKEILPPKNTNGSTWEASETRLLFTPLFRDTNTFDSLGYYPYFPYVFASCSNNNYYYPS
jgi:hypothetical protein